MRNVALPGVAGLRDPAPDGEEIRVVEHPEDVRDDLIIHPQHRVRVDAKDQAGRNREPERPPRRTEDPLDPPIPLDPGCVLLRLPLLPAEQVTPQRPTATPEHADQEEILEEPEVPQAVKLVRNRRTEPPPQDVVEREASGHQQRVSPDKIEERQDRQAGEQQRPQQPAHPGSQENPGPAGRAGRGSGNARRQEEHRHGEAVDPVNEIIERHMTGGVVGRPERQAHRGRQIRQRRMIEKDEKRGPDPQRLQGVAHLRRATATARLRLRAPRPPPFRWGPGLRTSGSSMIRRSQTTPATCGEPPLLPRVEQNEGWMQSCIELASRDDDTLPKNAAVVKKTCST